MNYAIVKDGVVTNVITLRHSQESVFPDCVCMGDIPVNIGDTYINGNFYRNGHLVSTAEQKANEHLSSVSALALSLIKSTCVEASVGPQANVGLFIAGAEEWEAGKAYERFDLIRYNGAIAWVKQAHTSQETWLPFSAGTESLYGARPVPDEDGIYPYVYNMAVELGMKVYHEGVVYECIQGTDSLLYTPDQVPALFKVVG